MTVVRGAAPLVGRILGLLYASGIPQSQRDISRKVGYELSAVSQVLNTLLGLGAVRRIKKPGERTGYYEPNMPVNAMLANAFDRWLEGEKNFHGDIKQLISKLREVQETGSREEEARRLLHVLEDMDSALQRLLEILEDARKKIQEAR